MTDYREILRLSSLGINHSQIAESIRYLLGCEDCHGSKTLQAMLPQGKIQFHKLADEQAEATSASILKVSKSVLAFNSDNALSMIRAALAVIRQAKPGEEVVLQIVLGPAYTPHPCRNASKTPTPHG